MIYLACTMWMLASMLQIKYGLSLWSTSIIEFNLANEIKFYVSNFLPYIREITVIASFAANKTALNVMHWLTINDIFFMMKSAKFD